MKPVQDALDIKFSPSAYICHNMIINACVHASVFSIPIGDGKIHRHEKGHKDQCGESIVEVLSQKKELRSKTYYKAST